MPPQNPQNVARIDRTFDDVLSIYCWHIQYLHTDAYAIRVEYELRSSSVQLVRSEDSYIRLRLWGEATDNLGNFYDGSSGAYGPSADKQFIEGVLSFTPLPVEGATSLSFCMTLIDDSDASETISFSVSLPPSSSHRKAE